jgi:hypothetical protein
MKRNILTCNTDNRKSGAVDGYDLRVEDAEDLPHPRIVKPEMQRFDFPRVVIIIKPQQFAVL